MKSIGVVTQSFCVRDSEGIEYELHDILGFSIIEIIYNAAGIRIDAYDNDAHDEKVFTFNRIVPGTKKNENNQDIYDYLAMRIKTGEYGMETELVDSDTGDTTYKRCQSEADVMPFGCCMFVPSGKHTRGIFTFQSFGRYGIISVMKKYVDVYLKRIDPGLRFVMDTIMPREYASKLFDEGILKSIRMIRYGIPDDMADMYGLDRGVEEIIEERVIRRPAGFLRNKSDQIRKYINRECKIDEVVVMDNYHIDDLKFEFQNGKRVKTLSLKNIDQLVISEDISEEILLENGHPKFEHLVEKMNEIAEYYMRARGSIVDEKV